MGLEATAAAAFLSTSISSSHAQAHMPAHTHTDTYTHIQRHKLAETQISREKLWPLLQTDDFIELSIRPVYAHTKTLMADDAIS